MTATLPALLQRLGLTTESTCVTYCDKGAYFLLAARAFSRNSTAQPSFTI
jgi:hypothetical protein